MRNGTPIILTREQVIRRMIYPPAGAEVCVGYRRLLDAVASGKLYEFDELRCLAMGASKDELARSGIPPDELHLAIAYPS